MPFESDQILLRLHADALERGDLDEAAEVWERLTLKNFDRINQIVKAFRFSAGGSGLPQDAWGSAANEAWLRAKAMGPSFSALEPGRFYAALKTCVDHSCQDYGRKEFRHTRRAGGSVDQTYEPDGEAGPYDGALARYESDMRQRASDAVHEELSRQEAESLFAWGISQISNDKYREVMELTWIHKVPADEIADQLGISLANVYQRRTRGLKELERILRDS